MDDTARAIARLQEETKAEKSAESRKGESAVSGNVPKRQAPPLVNGMGRRKVGGAPPQTSTKRPKTGGA